MSSSCRVILVVLMFPLWTASADDGAFSLGRGMKGRVVSKSAPAGGGGTAATRPPLEGPLVYIAVTATDQWANDELVTTVSAHTGLAGDPLPAATEPYRIGILDSGAATHVIAWEDADALGITGAYVTDFEFPVGGVAGSADMLVSVPIGVFAHGLQDLNGGSLQPGLLLGQGNFPLAANTEANANLGLELPSVIGAPYLAFYAVSVRNSQPVVMEFQGERLWSPSAVFFPDPFDFGLPSHGHEIPLQMVPGGDPTVAFFALPDFLAGGYLAILPALIGQLSGSLYFTASNNLRVEGNGVSFPVRLLVDTGAQACIFSRNVAFDLGLDIGNPPFEVEVEGIGGSIIAPGVYIERMSIPSSGGNVVWTNIPAVVLDLQDPSGNIMDGVLGANLLATRDWVFNGAALSPYLDISDPVVTPEPRITAMRRSADGVVEVDWRSEPATAGLRLEAALEPTADEAGWESVAAGDLDTVVGTMTYTSTVERAVFRLAAP